MANKPSIPKGTRDYSPRTVLRRNYIFTTIKEVFESFGYQPIETPAMETLETLMGKYGEEGDKLIFKILNSGDYLGKPEVRELIGSTSMLPELSETSRLLSAKISEKALRYDLTVPFARYVVQHRNELTLPFRRYQIQPVWRADRPQKGRYREFYQCDVDVIGSNSLLNEAELITIIDTVFTRLNIKVSIRLNNRKILAGLAHIIGQPEKLTDLTVAIDKLDKIGLNGVMDELLSKGIPAEQIKQLMPLLSSSQNFEDTLQQLSGLFSGYETGLLGIAETRTIFEMVQKTGIHAELIFDLSLARGLSYYTGAIIEVKALETEMGSICGGGRYDDLTGIFGMPDMSGVGVSFGADRIFDVLDALQRFPESTHTLTQVLFLNFGNEEVILSQKIAARLRNEGFKVEVYPDEAKVKKQMQYADQNLIPVVAIIGDEEKKLGTVSLKQMSSGEQVSLDAKHLTEQLSHWLR